jgi:hypothetical protein
MEHQELSRHRTHLPDYLQRSPLIKDALSRHPRIISYSPDSFSHFNEAVQTFLHSPLKETLLITLEDSLAQRDTDAHMRSLFSDLATVVRHWNEPLGMLESRRDSYQRSMDSGYVRVDAGREDENVYAIRCSPVAYGVLRQAPREVLLVDKARYLEPETRKSLDRLVDCW